MQQALRTVRADRDKQIQVDVRRRILEDRGEQLHEPTAFTFVLGAEHLLALIDRQYRRRRRRRDIAVGDAGRRKVPCYTLAALPEPVPLTTAYTISVGTPEELAVAAAAARARPLLKIKRAGRGDPERLAAVRLAAPDAQLIADAKESWDESNLAENLAACERAGVELLEQPLPTGADSALAGLPHRLVICADESVHDCASLPRLAGKYDAVNIKLDKTGSLTEAIKLANQAEQAGFALMVGCMLGTSLSIVPAFPLAQLARTIDLDEPLLLAADRPDGLHFEGSVIGPPHPTLWG
jgi:L-Ala-D/L-Glu epimerase